MCQTGRKPDFLQVAIGIRKVNFDRLLTLRIYPEGIVDRRITDEDGSVRWEVVYRP